MNSRLNDGGPAFPTQNQGDCRTSEDGTTYWQYPGLPGMSLRDWFAGQALSWTGALAVLARTAGQDLPPATVDDIAKDAYLLADAMLAARKQQ